jgi:antibiotic biosynthesis monooxygenase (ABM) superfamily enzyme
MSKITRRTLIRNGSITASMVTLTPSTSRENGSESVFHAFAFQWKPGTTEAQKDKAAREIAAFQGQIPGLLQTHVGPNISPRGKGYTFGGIMQFKDKAALDAYVQNPAHQALLVWLVQLIDAIELHLRASHKRPGGLQWPKRRSQLRN